MEFARRHRLLVIEDAAEAHGGTYRGKLCGSFGDFGCFSFYANKIITAGEGGMIVTSDAGLAARARSYRDLCHSPERRFVHTDVGYNFRMTNMQAAVGAGELENIEAYVVRKQVMAERYTAGLRDVPGLRLPITRPHVRNVFWMYTIVVDEQVFGMGKDALRGRLEEQGIDTRDVFYAPSEQPALIKRLGPLPAYPRTEFLSQRACYLPSGLATTDEEIDRVIAAVRGLHRQR